MKGNVHSRADFYWNPVHKGYINYHVSTYASLRRTYSKNSEVTSDGRFDMHGTSQVYNQAFTAVEIRLCWTAGTHKGVTRPIRYKKEWASSLHDSYQLQYLFVKPEVSGHDVWELCQVHMEIGEAA